MATNTSKKEVLYEAYGKITGIYLELPDGKLGYINYMDAKKDNKEKNEIYGKIKSRYSKFLGKAFENGNELKIELLNVDPEPIKDKEGKVIEKDGKPLYRVKNVITGYEFDEKEKKYKPKEGVKLEDSFKPYGVAIEFVSGKDKNGNYFKRKETVKPGEELYSQLVAALSEKGASKFGVHLTVRSTVETGEDGKKKYNYKIESITPILKEKEKEAEKESPKEIETKEPTKEEKKPKRKKEEKKAPKVVIKDEDVSF